MGVALLSESMGENSGPFHKKLPQPLTRAPHHGPGPRRACLYAAGAVSSATDPLAARAREILAGEVAERLNAPHC